jgi:hypothetical protein
MVLSITTILAGLLFPVLSEARQRADRVISANNLRTIGMAVTMFDADSDSLPEASLLEEPGRSPSELTCLFRPERDGMLDVYRVEMRGWDGLGRLWQWGYIDSPKTFFAPHLIDSLGHEQVETMFWNPGDVEIHGDYHYGGHRQWDETGAVRSLSDPGLVIASDTLRKVTQLNHREGMNLVRSDGSVQWISFPEVVLDSLARPEESPNEVRDRYVPLWRALEGYAKP